MQNTMILDCATRFNISDENVVKLIETLVIFPSNSEALIERVKALHVLSILFFEHDK